MNWALCSMKSEILLGTANNNNNKDERKEKSPMQEVEVPRMVSVPTSLSTSPHTFLFSSSTSGTHSWMYLAPVTHSARLAVPLEKT